MTGPVGKLREIICMQVGDLVKHKHGTLHGSGLICEFITDHCVAGRRAYVLWTSHGHTTRQNVATLYLEVISEGR